MWRPSVISGQVISGESPVIGLSDNQTNTTEPQPAEETTVQPTSLDLDEDGWQPISEINPKSKDPSPTKIMFPNHSSVQINSWKLVLIEVARWLIENNKLDKDHCPIRFSDRANATNYIVATRAIHSHGIEFHASEKIGSFYIETSHDTPNCVKGAERLIRHVGQNPAQFKVRIP